MFLFCTNIVRSKVFDPGTTKSTKWRKQAENACLDANVVYRELHATQRLGLDISAGNVVATFMQYVPVFEVRILDFVVVSRRLLPAMMCSQR